MRTHLVWDWNGTLFDDRDQICEAVARTASSCRGAAIDAGQARARASRPLRAWFERLLSTRIADSEWAGIEQHFHAEYRRLCSSGHLVDGAREVLSRARARTGSQHVLSLWPHEDLVELIRELRLTHLFDEVRGADGGTGGKHEGLLALLRRRGLAPGQVTVIGDTADDGAAAHACGTGAVLVNSASLLPLPGDRGQLHGIPVAASIADAVELALTAPCRV